DVKLTTFQNQEIGDNHLGVDVSTEGQFAASEDRDRVQLDRAVHVVGHGGVGGNVHDVARRRQAVAGPGVGVRPRPAAHANDSWVGTEVRNLVVRRGDEVAGDVGRRPGWRGRQHVGGGGHD